MNPMPSITVAVPAFQRVRYIREALESALSQDYENFDVFVSDDSDHDEIEKIAQSLKSDRLRYVRNSPSLGLLPKLNRFLDESRGDWVVILCDDDRFEPGFLRALAAKIAAHPDATSARCRYRLMDENGKETGMDAPIPESLSPLEFLSRIFLPPSAFLTINITGVIFSKKVLREAGGFANLYKGLHTDRIAWARLAALGTTVYDPRPLCSLRIHRQSESGGTHDDARPPLEATRQAEQAIGSILEFARTRIADDRDRALFELARERAAAYVGRSLSSGLDRSLRGVLLRRGAGPSDLQAAVDVARSLRVPPVRLEPLYRFLIRLPFELRKFLLRGLDRLKR